MSRKINDYLEKVARELRHLPANVRENEVREMRSHLEQLRDDFASQGQNPEMAAQMALAQFGEARAVAIAMRDVWEGQDFGWKRVLAAFLFGLLFWGRAMVGLMFGTLAFQFLPQSALFPQETWLFFVAASLLIPTVTGAIHSFYLGRRAWIMSVAAYVPLWIAEIVFHQGPSLSLGDYKMSFWAWSLVWGISGACLSDLWRRQQRYTALALAGSTSSASISPRALPRASRRKANWKLAILVVLLALGMDAKWRLEPAIHPQTAGDAVQTQLLLARDATKLDPPDPIVIEEVTPTAAEVAAGTRRVRFYAVCHATKAYREQRLDFLQAQLASPQQRKLWGAAALRASLQRVRVNAYSIRGVIKVKKTPNKWQVEAESFDWSRLHGWIEDIYFSQ